MKAMHPIGCLVVGIALLALPAGCARTTPEQQLRDTVARLQDGIESRDVGVVKQVLADDFIGPDGLDRKGAVRMAQLDFLQHDSIGATVGPLRIQWFPSASAPDHATVRFTAVLTGGSGTMLPEQAQVYQVQTGWRREGNAWQLTSATWNP